MAAANRPESKRLRRSSLPVSPFADTVLVVLRAGNGGKGRGGRLLDACHIFGVLDAFPLRRQAPTDMAGRDPELLQRLFLSDEYGKGTAVDHHHLGARYPPAFPTKIHMAAAADVRLCVDIQPVPAAVGRGDHLDHYYCVEREKIRMAAARLHDRRDDPREHHQPLFSEQYLPFC